MKNLKILTMSSILATSLFALQQQNVDYISMSMGGAGVASSYGSMSATLNPALVNNKDNKRTEIGLSVGIGIQEHELGDDLNKLDEAGVDDTLNSIENGDGNDEIVENNANQISEALNNLVDKANNYLMLSPTVGLSFKIGTHFSLGINAMVDAKITAVVDKKDREYIYYDEENDKYIGYDPDDEDDNGDDYYESNEDDYNNNSLDKAIKDGDIRLDVNGISISEIPLTYANDLELKGTTINWGVTAKYMVGTTTNTKILFTDDDYDPSKELDENTVDTTTFGLDAGIIIQPSNSNFKLALAGKNLNQPEFDLADGGVYKLEPKITTGLAYSATDILDIAIDYDLTEITDELTDQKFQYLGGGLNFHPLTWFSLRAGARTNLADKDDYNGIIYTAGMSFGLKWLQLDIAGEMSENSGDYDGDSIARYTKLNVALVSKWGDN